MKQRKFWISLIIEGTTEKVLQFKMPLKSIYNKTLTLLNKFFLNPTEKFKQ